MTSPYTTATNHSPLTPPTAHASHGPDASANHLPPASAEQVTQQTVHTLVHEVSPAISRMADGMAALSRQGMQAVQSSGHALGDKVHHASDRTLGYIRNEPVKSVLMAVALGASLVTVFHLISRPHNHR